MSGTGKQYNATCRELNVCLAATTTARMTCVQAIPPLTF